VEGIGERNRGIYILKSRGMGHSNQVREFIITDNGIKMLNFEIGPNGILTGSARTAHALKEKALVVKWKNELDRKDREVARRKKILESTIASLRTEFESEEEDLNKLKIENALQENLVTQNKLNGTQPRFAKPANSKQKK
jgi:circadian clock protein KaiC